MLESIDAFHIRVAEERRRQQQQHTWENSSNYPQTRWKKRISWHWIKKFKAFFFIFSEMIFLLGRWVEGVKAKENSGKVTNIFIWMMKRHRLCVRSMRFICAIGTVYQTPKFVNLRMSRQLRKSKSYDTSSTNHSTEAIERSGENGT